MAAEWTKSPEKALEHFLSMTFEEQIALEYVINWRRQVVQAQAQEMINHLKAQYTEAKDRNAC
jgi:hypothetical protein